MDFKLTVLGTASALPVKDRYPSAQVLSVHGRFFLIDCGEGTQVQLRRCGISFHRIEAVFISHIHGDHVFGLFGLLSTMSMLGRTAVLHIYAPKSFGGILRFFLTYFGEGMSFEIEHHPLSMKSPEVILETKPVNVSAFPLKHKTDCFGFLFRENEPQLNVRKDAIVKYGLSLEEIAAAKNGLDIVREPGDGSFADYMGRVTERQVIPSEQVAYRPYVPRSFAYCSDTMYFPELAGWVKGCDLLYHEATYPEEMLVKAGERFHSTASQAALCASNAGVSKLLIGHFSSKYTDHSVFLEEACAVFPQTELAEELKSYEIPLCKMEIPC